MRDWSIFTTAGDKIGLVMTAGVDPLDRSLDPLKGGDIYRWAMEQAVLIRDRRFDEIDIINEADEIEDVGRSDYRALGSCIVVRLLRMRRASI